MITYPAHLEQRYEYDDPSESSYFVITFPDFPILDLQAGMFVEAVELAKKSLLIEVNCRKDLGLELPVPSANTHGCVMIQVEV